MSALYLDSRHSSSWSSRSRIARRCGLAGKSRRPEHVVSPSAHQIPAGGPTSRAGGLPTVREGLRRVDLIGIDDRILDAAGILEPQVLRTLDAIHLATAMAVGDDLETIVTYDGRMVDAARVIGLSTGTPR